MPFNTQSPTVSFKTVGCRLNQAETATMAARFEEAGYELAEFGAPCDVAVIHTCTVTNQAERTCVRLARAVKREGVPTVVLAGCAVEDAGERLRAESGADIVVGQKEKFLLPEIIRSAEPKTTNHTQRPTSNARRPTPVFASTRAMVKVQDGCDFRCAYCIVPSTRGAPASRPLAPIVGEIRELAEFGYKEVVLTGANLGRYRDGNNRLVDVLEAVESISLIERIRISSIETSTTEREIIDHMANSEKLCQFLHLPLQSGDDDVLLRMGRRYTSAQYREVIEYAADRVPGIGLGADVIVGLPGEDQSAFRNTVELVESLPFSNLHVFSYSKRKGTRAAEMPDQILSPEKKQRAAVMIELGKRKRTAFAESFVGNPVSVLIERFDEDGAGRGWTREYVDARLTQPGPRVNEVVDFVPRIAENGILR